MLAFIVSPVDVCVCNCKKKPELVPKTQPQIKLTYGIPYSKTFKVMQLVLVYTVQHSIYLKPCFWPSCKWGGRNLGEGTDKMCFGEKHWFQTETFNCLQGNITGGKKVGIDFGTDLSVGRQKVTDWGVTALCLLWLLCRLWPYKCASSFLVHIPFYSVSDFEFPDYNLKPIFLPKIVKYTNFCFFYKLEE